jgi:hypothetical protein
MSPFPAITGAVTAVPRNGQAHVTPPVDTDGDRAAIRRDGNANRGVPYRRRPARDAVEGDELRALRAGDVHPVRADARTIGRKAAGDRCVGGAVGPDRAEHRRGTARHQANERVGTHCRLQPDGVRKAHTPADSTLINRVHKGAIVERLVDESDHVGLAGVDRCDRRREVVGRLHLEDVGIRRSPDDRLGYAGTDAVHRDRTIGGGLAREKRRVWNFDVGVERTRSVSERTRCAVVTRTTTQSEKRGERCRDRPPSHELQ